jgi:hypothetical protein
MIDTLFRPLEGPQIVKADLNLGHLRLLVRLFCWILVVSTIIYGFFYVTTPQNSKVHTLYQLLSLGYQACFTLIAPFLLFYTILFILNIPSLKEREKRRQAAASGDQRLLAKELFTPDIYNISLPLTITARPDWPILLTFLVVMLPCMGVLAFAFSSLRPDPVFDILLFIIAGVLVICFSVFLLWKLSLQNSIQLVVTENGLTLLGLQSTALYLAWQDIRLFAIDAHLVFLKKNRPTLFFEISGIDEVIHWAWKLSNNSHDSHLTKLASSSEEYDRQVLTLFSLIVARTGLPLYDLRKR